MDIVPEKPEIIKFDEEGNTDLKPRLLARLRAFLDSRLFLAVLVALVALVSFELGLLANLGRAKPPVTITEPTIDPDARLIKTGPVSQASNAGEGSQPKKAQGGGLVASKGGTKYYYPWCGSASRISDKNKIYFASVTEARAKGYTPAANCQGLQ